MAPPIHLKWTQKCLTWVSRGFLFGGQLDGMNRLHSRLFARPLTSSKLTSTFLNCPFELNYTTESLGSQSSPSVHPTSRIPEHPRASQSIPEHPRASQSIAEHRRCSGVALRSTLFNYEMAARNWHLHHRGRRVQLGAHHSAEISPPLPPPTPGLPRDPFLPRDETVEESPQESPQESRRISENSNDPGNTRFFPPPTLTAFLANSFA